MLQKDLSIDDESLDDSRLLLNAPTNTDSNIVQIEITEGNPTNANTSTNAISENNDPLLDDVNMLKDGSHAKPQHQPSEDPSVIEVDDGKTLLYPDVKTTNFPFKTSDRIIDDIICDLTFEHVNNHKGGKSSILSSSPLLYSQLRQSVNPSTLGSIIDQVAIQSKFEYDSITCPQYNKLQVFFGVLYNLNIEEIENKSQLLDIPIYQLKVTVKTRSQLELYKKHAGISQYFMLEELHPFDQQDLQTFDKYDPNLIDYAMYVSSDTNKLILIEIFKPEFISPEECNMFTDDAIKSRYSEACGRLEGLNPDTIPNQFDCISMLLKLFKGPLNRKSSSDPLKTIDSHNMSLNSHINPKLLVDKYHFNLIHDENNGNVTAGEQAQNSNDIIEEYAPPDFTDYINDPKARKLKESYIRKCLHLIFLAKLLISFLNDEERAHFSTTSKSFRILHLINIQYSTKPLYQIFGESKSNFLVNSERYSPLDINYHFVNLSVSYYYSDRDIIQNYETLCILDPKNIGVYYDALSFVANRKGSYQLLGYCGKQNIVGKEALDSALSVFKIDPNSVDINKGIDENMLLSIYKHEQILNPNTNYLMDMKNALRVLAKFKNSEYIKFYVDHEPYKMLSQAYSELEVGESVDEDIIQTAYTIKINDAPGLKMECDRALYTIALYNRSMLLFDYLLEQCPAFMEYYGPDKYTYQEALSMVQVNENATDDLILKIFQQKWDHDAIVEPDQFLNLKSALTKICFERNSKLISTFLSTGLIDPNCLPPENWPIGLNNIGNTCYLNSLLQYYFAIEPLRTYICNYQNTIEYLETKEKQTTKIRRIGGREVSDNEVERSVQFTYQLRDLFNKMIYSTNRCVTPSQELAYLAFAPSNVEVEFESEKQDNGSINGSVAEVIIENDTEVNNVEGTVDMGGLERHDVVLEDASQNSVPCVNKVDKDDSKFNITKDDNDVDMIGTENEADKKVSNTSTRIAKIESEQLENALEMGRQQDVTECIGNVLYQLESAADPIRLEDDNEQYDLIKQLFYGKTKQSIIPLNDTKDPRIKYERFLSLLVNVSDHPKDIYDALDAYFMEEYLTLEEYGDVRKTLAVTEFPTILQIQIQRVYYDRERFVPFKSIEPLPFPQTLYMDRYMESDDEMLMTKRLETNELKLKLKKLRERHDELLNRNNMGLSRKEAFMETKHLLESDILEQSGIAIDGKESLAETLQGKVTDINNELSSIINQIADLERTIDHQFDKFQSIGYSLFAVFIHRGEASYGHYWVYVKDLNNTGIWRKYNDETVSEVQESEVFNFVEGNTATPYFLVLVKQDHESEIEPLKRVLEEDID